MRPMRSSIFNPDRRIIYILLLLALAVPLIRPLGLPIPISSETRQSYDFVNGLGSDAKVLISFGYGPSVAAELTPEANIILAHLAQKGIKTYAVSQSVDGDKLAAGIVKDAFTAAHKVAGVDYVYLGYLAGGESGLAAMSDSIAAVFTTDSQKTPLAQLPIMTGVEKISSFDLVIDLEGSGVAPWVRQVYTKNNVNLIFGVMAVMASGTVPYVQAGQAVGMLTGLKGAAEYEALMQAPGAATASMDAQSMGHALIIIFIILGNIGYYRSRKTKTV